MPEKLDRCVDDVKGQKGVDSAYAICQSAVNKKKETHLQEKHKFPYPFPAINSKDATEEAVAIGGGLSAQSVGGKVIKPDKEFNKLHEALMQEAEPAPPRNPEDAHPFGEGQNPFAGGSMDVSAEGRDPSVTLDPEPSPTEHRDPSQTLDPATEQYDYGTDEGGPGSGPQNDGGKKLPFGQDPQGQGNVPSPFRVSKADATVDDIRKIGGQTTVEDWSAKTGEDPQALQADFDKMVSKGKLYAQDDEMMGTIYSVDPFSTEEGGFDFTENVIEACPQMDKLNEALKHESS